MFLIFIYTCNEAFPYISNYEKNLNDYYRGDIDFLTNDYNKMQEELRAIEKDYIYYLEELLEVIYDLKFKV